MARILITSAIPYINGIKHLGNLVGSQLPADLFARFNRAMGHEVMFICATDEHGTPPNLRPPRPESPWKNTAPRCTKCRPRSPSRLPPVLRPFRPLLQPAEPPADPALRRATGADNGLIAEVSEKQVFSIDDNRFLPDRYITGTCPNCGYEAARGDQCENCTKQLDPTDLINPRSSISGSTNLEVRETKHLYLKQRALRDKLEAWIDSKTDWPILTTSIAKKWLNDGDGLAGPRHHPRPSLGHPGQEGRPALAGDGGQGLLRLVRRPHRIHRRHRRMGRRQRQDRRYRLGTLVAHRQGPSDVTYYQFMGKDNVPFHTLSFPATILGSGEPWKLVDYLKSFNYLNYDGGQFSTSQGRGVFMDQALSILPADYWRWWLLSHAPESSDSEFTWENFQTSVNKDLADVLGNLVSRVTKFAVSKFGNDRPRRRQLRPA